MNKKVLSVLLAMSMVLSLLPAAFAAESDGEVLQSEIMVVSEDKAATEGAMARWAKAGIFKGDQYGDFMTEKDMTRAEFAQVMVNLLGYTEIAENVWVDISSDPVEGWYKDAMLKLAAAGVMQGAGYNEVGPIATPNAPLTTEQAAVLLCRALKVSAKKDSTANVSKVSDWAKDAVAALADMGAIEVSAAGEVTTSAARGSLAEVMDNMIAEYVTEDGATVTGNKDGVIIIAADNVVLKDVAADSVLVAPKAEDTTVTLSGNTAVADVTVAAKGTEVVVEKNATAGSVTVEAPETKVDVKGTVDTVAVAEGADDAAVVTTAGAKVGSVTTDAANTDIKAANNTVKNVVAGETATGTTVAAPGAKLENNSAEKVNNVASGSTGNTPSKPRPMSPAVPAATETPAPDATYTVAPDATATPAPSAAPSTEPTAAPSAAPSAEPTTAPSSEPTTAPSSEPTTAPATETPAPATPAPNAAEFKAMTSALYDVAFPADTWTGRPDFAKVVPTFGTATVAGDGTVTIPVTGTIGYAEGFTGFHPLAAQQAGNFIAFYIPVPAEAVGQCTIVAKNGAVSADGATTTDKTFNTTAAGLDPLDDGKVLALIVRLNAAGNKKATYVIDWDGAGTAETATTYVLDYSGATLVPETGIVPTATPTATATVAPTATTDPTPTATADPTPTATTDPTPTATADPTPTETTAPTAEPTTVAIGTTIPFPHADIKAAIDAEGDTKVYQKLTLTGCTYESDTSKNHVVMGENATIAIPVPDACQVVVTYNWAANAKVGEADRAVYTVMAGGEVKLGATTATYDYTGTEEGTVTVTGLKGSTYVTKIEVKAAAATPDTAKTLEVSSTADVSVEVNATATTVIYAAVQNGTEEDLTVTPSDETVATVAKNATTGAWEITGVAEGTATITFASGSDTEEIAVTVTDSTPAVPFNNSTKSELNVYNTSTKSYEDKAVTWADGKWNFSGDHGPQSKSVEDATITILLAKPEDGKVVKVTFETCAAYGAKEGATVTGPEGNSTKLAIEEGNGTWRNDANQNNNVKSYQIAVTDIALTEDKEVTFTVSGSTYIHGFKVEHVDPTPAQD